MTREQAIDKVRQLREVTVERGATEGEADAAKLAEARLMKRFGLHEGDIAMLLPPPRVPPAAAPFNPFGNPFGTPTFWGPMPNTTGSSGNGPTIRVAVFRV